MSNYDFFKHEGMDEAASELRNARDRVKAEKVKWLNEIAGTFASEVVDYIYNQDVEPGPQGLEVARAQAQMAVEWKLGELIAAVRYGEEQL